MLVGAHPCQSIRLCTKIGVTVSSHPCQQRTHLCTFIHKLKGQLMVVGNHLLKDESQTDSHLECEVTTAQNFLKKKEREREDVFQNRFIKQTSL